MARISIFSPTSLLNLGRLFTDGNKNFTFRLKELIAGSGVTLTDDTTNNRIVIASSSTGAQGPPGASMMYEDAGQEDIIVPVFQRLPDNVVQTVTTTQYVVTGAFADITGLSVTISPRYQSSKIRITAVVNCYFGTALTTMAFKLLRGASLAKQYDTATLNNNAGVIGMPVVFDHLDSPASVAAQTYKMQAKNTNGGGAVNFVVNVGDVIVSTITAEEILQ